MTGQTYDVALKVRPTGQAQIALPVEIGRALEARGYDRVTVTVTDNGILLRPYIRVGDGTRELIKLPDWNHP